MEVGFCFLSPCVRRGGCGPCHCSEKERIEEEERVYRKRGFDFFAQNSYEREFIDDCGFEAMRVYERSVDRLNQDSKITPWCPDKVDAAKMAQHVSHKFLVPMVVRFLLRNHAKVCPWAKGSHRHCDDCVIFSLQDRGRDLLYQICCILYMWYRETSKTLEEVRSFETLFERPAKGERQRDLTERWMHILQKNFREHAVLITATCRRLPHHVALVRPLYRALFHLRYLRSTF